MFKLFKRTKITHSESDLKAMKEIAKEVRQTASINRAEGIKL